MAKPEFKIGDIVVMAVGDQKKLSLFCIQNIYDDFSGPVAALRYITTRQDKKTIFSDPTFFRKLAHIKKATPAEIILFG